MKCDKVRRIHSAYPRYIVAIAAMSPGPVAINVSIGLGLLLNGLPGVGVAFIGTTIPCILFVAAFFMKTSNHPIVQGVLYGLKAVIPSIIFFAAVKMGMQNDMLLSANFIRSGWNIVVEHQYFEVKSLVIISVTMLLLLRTKIHPILLILSSATIGVWLFQNSLSKQIVNSLWDF